MGILSRLLLVLLLAISSSAQVLVQRPAPAPADAEKTPLPPPAAAPAASSSPALLPGTVLRITLDQEVRLRQKGQVVHGVVTEPVYANDKLVIPAGTPAVGTIVDIAPVSKKVRTMDALNADFSPAHSVEIEFDHVQLPSGTALPIQTKVSTDQGGTLQLVTADDKKPSTTQVAHNVASKKITEVRQELRREWDSAKAQLTAPDKMHRLKRRAIAQLPYHPQYLDKGMSFNADLLQPVATDGVPRLSSQEPAVADNLLHAALKTPLSSATSKPGDPVEAVLTRPLYFEEKVLYPAGTRLEGSVVQVRAAGKLHHNGMLRIRFQQVIRPGGPPVDLDSDLQGIEVTGDQQISLDSEGGAEARTPKTRYAATALAIALAAAPLHRDREDAAEGEGPSGTTGAASGASGYRLIGTVLGAASRSRVVASGLGFYGAAASVYTHFLSRGRDVVYPKDMAMIISVRQPEKPKVAETSHLP